TAVVYIAGIAGLIGLLGSAAAYIISETPNIYKLLMWNDEIKIWEFSARYYPNYTLSLSNVGDGPIIISTILLFWGKGSNIQYKIGKLVQPHDSLVMTAPRETRQDYSTDVANTSGKPNTTVMSNAGIVFEDSSGTSPCFMMWFLSADAIEIDRMQNAYSRMNLKIVEESVQGVVVYYSLHDRKEARASFPVVATFEQSTKPECMTLKYQD
ncbi:MAG: hypothetical protein WB676_19945, partial [Bryobacteraceae bacterium]